MFSRSAAGNGAASSSQCMRASAASASSGASTSVAAPAAARAALEQLRAGRADEQQRDVARPAREVVDELEQRLLGPVQVVEHDDQRPAARERLEQLADRPERLLAPGRRAREAERAGEPRLDVAPRRPRRRGARPAWPRPRRPSRRRSIRAAARIASAIGQYVMPSPYARQLPTSTCASGCTDSASSARRRVFPAPAGAATVTISALRPSTVLRHAATSRASSLARPTSGASSRR